MSHRDDSVSPLHALIPSFRFFAIWDLDEAGPRFDLCNLRFLAIAASPCPTRYAGNTMSTNPLNLSSFRIAVLGAGKMGGILLQAFLKQQILSTGNLFATVAHAEKA